MNENDVKREQAMAQTGQRSHKRRRRIRWQFLAVLTVFVLGIIAALCLTVLFPVREVTVQGKTRYTNEAVVDVSAIEMQSNLILLDSDRARERILEQLPYIGNCELEKKLDGTVILTVSELPAVRAYLNGDTYYLVNEKNKVVETAATQPEAVCIILGADAETPRVGQIYTPADTAADSVLTRLNDSIEEYKLDVTRVDFTAPTGLRFVVDDRILVEFGGETDLEYKMAHLATTLESMSDSDEGTLDLTWWTTAKKDAYFRRGNILEILYGEDYVDPNAPADDTSSNDASSQDDADVEDGGESDPDTTDDPDTTGEDDGDFDEE